MTQKMPGNIDFICVKNAILNVKKHPKLKTLFGPKPNSDRIYFELDPKTSVIRFIH